MSKRSEKIMAALGVRLQRVRQEGTEHVTWEVAPSQSFRQESDHLEGNKTRQYPDNLIHFNETKTRENPDNNLMPFEGTETKENPENVMPLDETATRENSDNNLMLLDDTETKENPENVMPLEETETRKNPHNLMPLDENQQIDSRSRSPRSNRSSSRPSRSRSSRSRSRSSSRGSSCSYSQVDATSADSNYTTGDESNSDSNSSGSDSNSSDEENNSTRHNTVRNSPPHNNVVKEKQITKKRPKKPAQWRRNVCKKLRNCGQKYETLSKKKVVQERKILTPCNDKCRLKCTGKFTDEAREYIFDAFWKLGDLQKQRSFVLSSMRSIPKQYTKVRPEGGSQRGCNKAYYFSINDVLTQVCQKFFTSTLGISERFVRTVVSKSTDGFIEGEMRGKHKKRNVPEDVKEGIREHLRTIPALESHYTRSNTARMYIDGSKTLSQLYKDYKELCNEAGRPSGTISMYRHIFNYEFNMPFHIPKKDQCLTCTSYTDGDNNAKAELQDKYDSHIKEKELTRTEKSNDKDKINQNYVVACFDLQATLPVPKGEISCFYYKSKLNCYNFTVCELQKKGIGNVDCYFWHEGEGKRGAIEIGTCLLKFLEKKAAAANSDELEIILYSDNCGGEGKNKFIVTILLYAVTTYKIKSITHKFFVVGHGQNEGDCTHSLIEKSIKRALKGGPIYVPAHYAAIISAARKSGTPFRVNEMDHSEFMDLKLFTKNVKTPFNQNTEKETFNFNSISIVKVEKCHPDRYFYKTSYSQTEYKSVLIVTKCQNTRRGSSSVADLELTSAYEQPLAVSTRKFEDLQSLLLNRSIPSVHSNFFRQLRKEN